MISHLGSIYGDSFCILPSFFFVVVLAWPLTDLIFFLWLDQKEINPRMPKGKKECNIQTSLLSICILNENKFPMQYLSFKFQPCLILYFN